MVGEAASPRPLSRGKWVPTDALVGDQRGIGVTFMGKTIMN